MTRKETNTDEPQLNVRPWGDRDDFPFGVYKAFREPTEWCYGHPLKPEDERAGFRSEEDAMRAERMETGRLAKTLEQRARAMLHFMVVHGIPLE